MLPAFRRSVTGGQEPLEIIKQLLDIGRMLDVVEDTGITRSAV